MLSDSGLVLEVPRAAVAAVGSRLTLSIRPERVQLSPKGDNRDAATAEGTIIEASYFGNAERYLVRLKGGETLVSQRPSTGLATLALGTAVSVFWVPRDVWAIPEGGG